MHALVSDRFYVIFPCCRILTLSIYQWLPNMKTQGKGALVFGADPVVVASERQLLVCTISNEPVGGFSPNSHGYNIWT